MCVCSSFRPCFATVGFDTRTIQPCTNASETDARVIHVGNEFVECFLSLGNTMYLIGKVVGLVVKGEL